MITVAGFLASVNGLPLNINLGAYSPALVVGDGEISFGGGQDVTNLLNALEGAAVTSAGAATNNAATDNVAQDIQALAVPADPTPTVVAVPKPTPSAVNTNQQQQDEQQGQQQEQATPKVSIQGMGKELEPREGSEQETAKAKRDLAGFDRALTFAEAALTKGPLIQLGTGEGGAGVGIIVDNNPPKAGGAAAAATEGAQTTAKRDEVSRPRRRAKVTRMYIKRGIPAAVQNSPDFETRSIKSLPAINLPALSKSDSPDSAIDAINLNIPGDEGVTMTFVETADEDDDDDEAAE